MGFHFPGSGFRLDFIQKLLWKDWNLNQEKKGSTPKPKPGTRIHILVLRIGRRITALSPLQNRTGEFAPHPAQALISPAFAEPVFDNLDDTGLVAKRFAAGKWPKLRLPSLSNTFLS